MKIIDTNFFKNIPLAIRENYERLPSFKKRRDAQEESREKEGEANKARKIEHSAANDEDREKEVERQMSLKRKAGAAGSPWNFPEQAKIKVAHLDLQRSYVDNDLIQEDLNEDSDEILPPRQKRWQHKGPKPLTDISKLVEMDWNTREPDLRSR